MVRCAQTLTWVMPNHLVDRRFVKEFGQIAGAYVTLGHLRVDTNTGTNKAVELTRYRLDGVIRWHVRKM